MGASMQKDVPMSHESHPGLAAAFDTAPRAALASAIANFTATKDYHDKVENLLRDKEEKSMDLLMAIDAAEARVDEAREREPGRLVNNLIVGKEYQGGEPTLEEAEALVSKLRAERGQVHKDRDLLQPELNRARMALGFATTKRDAAIKAVVAAEVDVEALQDKAAALHSQAQALTDAVVAMSFACRVDFHGRYIVEKPSPPCNPELANQIKAALEALATDANTPLPKLPI